MKKYGVIHHSHNWVMTPSIPKFDTLKEAQKYLKDFRGNYAHRRDHAEIFETISKHEAVPVDQTQDGVLYGFEIKNEKGFGLIELMVSVGLISLVMLGVMQTITQAVLVSETADQKAALTALVNSTAGQAVNTTTCTAAITATPQTYGQNLQFGSLSNGVNLVNYGLTVTSLTYSSPALIETGYDGTKVYYGTIMLTTKSNKTILGSQNFAPRLIAQVYLTVSPTNQITACGAVLPTLPTAPTNPTQNPSQQADNAPTEASPGFQEGCKDLGGIRDGKSCVFPQVTPAIIPTQAVAPSQNQNSGSTDGCDHVTINGSGI